MKNLLYTCFILFLCLNTVDAERFAKDIVLSYFGLTPAENLLVMFLPDKDNNSDWFDIDYKQLFSIEPSLDSWYIALDLM